MCNAVEPQLSGFVGTRWNSLWDNWDMNINEEQKLIKLRKQHLIVKQSIYKSFGKKIWSTSSVSVMNTNIYLQ